MAPIEDNPAITKSPNMLIENELPVIEELNNTSIDGKII